VNIKDAANICYVQPVERTELNFTRRRDIPRTVHGYRITEEDKRDYIVLMRRDNTWRERESFRSWYEAEVLAPRLEEEETLNSLRIRR
jgi:hypothetical protein